MDQKLSSFICPRVSARFLQCFCTVSRDAMGTLTCKIRQRVQKLHSEKSRCFAQKQRKLETSKIRVFCPVGSFNQRARDSSSLERTKRTINRWDKRFVVFFILYGLLGLVPMIFSKILEVRGTKMKKIHEELWAERRRELPPRQERSPRRHGAGPHQDEPAAGARVKTSVERRRPTAFRDGGLTVFLFKTGKYWNGKGRNIPYKWRFKSRNLAQRPKLRFGCLTKRR